MIIFCKKCQYVGMPITVKPTKKNDNGCEVCPKCMVIKHAEYYVDAAAAHHAQANFQNNQESKKSV